MSYTGIRWTASEDAVLVRLHKTGLGYSEISRQLSGRTPKAVRMRLALLRERAERPTEPTEPWTDEEVARLLQLRGERVCDILQMFPGRSILAIRCKRNQLGIYTRKLTRNQPPPPPRAARPVVITVEELERPLGVPFTTASGLRAIRLASGTVPYVPSLYGHLSGGPLGWSSPSAAGSSSLSAV